MSQESFTSVSNERNCTSEHICTSKSVSLSDGSMLRIAILTAIQGGLFYGSIYVGQVSAGIFLISEHCFFPCRGK